MRVLNRFKAMRLAVVSAVVAALVATSLVATPTHAAETDALNVAFGGSLVGTEDYTGQGDELKRGVLQRIDGDEDQLESGGVGLAGGAEGIRFLPNTFALDSGTQSFLMETRFTAASYDNLDTILSAGGNLFVRAQNGKLRYGWSGESGGTWQNYTQEAELPAGDGPHMLSIHYRYAAGGTTLDVMLNGESLPSLTGALPLTVAAGATNMFGFGNDVHPQAADRGITGTLHAVRVAATDGAAGNPFEFQPRELTTDLLNVSFEGTVTPRHPVSLSW